MICPRCANEISANETICPFCHADVSPDIEFNDFKEDGFVRSTTRNSSVINNQAENNKYINATRNLVVITVLFLLTVAVVTIFSFKALQYFTNDTPADIVVEPYVPATDSAEEEEEIKNTIKKVTIENLYGSWKGLDTTEDKKHAIPYFTFNKDGSAQYDYGTFSINGYTQDFSSKKENLVYIEIESQITGLFDFDVKGNPKDGYQMTLKNKKSGMTYFFESAEAKTYKMPPFEKSIIDKKIIGTWESRNGDRSYKFTKDGQFERKVRDQVMKGAWSRSKDNKNLLTLKYMERSVITVNLSYSIYDDTLIINDMMYYKK